MEKTNDIIDPCEACLGKGYLIGLDGMTCPKCNGQGCYVKECAK